MGTIKPDGNVARVMGEIITTTHTIRNLAIGVALGQSVKLGYSSISSSSSSCLETSPPFSFIHTEE